MTNKLKCPFCGGEMLGCIGHPVCYNSPDCPIHNEDVPRELLDLLDSTRKDLEIATKALKDIASGQIIEHSVFGHECDNKIAIARKALKQIEHKDNK